jgi:predicted nucleic acid-binding protein
MLLLDASVWIAAADSEDKHHAAARALVLDLERPLGALDLALYEIANVVGIVKRQRETATRICRALLKRSEGRLVRVDDALAEQAILLAAEHELTAYDAAYVAAAHKYAWKLVSLDIKDLVRPGLAVTPDDPDL